MACFWNALGPAAEATAQAEAASVKARADCDAQKLVIATRSASLPVAFREFEVKPAKDDIEPSKSDIAAAAYEVAAAKAHLQERGQAQEGPG